LYDERKKESERLLVETATKRAKIGETMEEINERLTNLEQEMAELREFQKLDKERRCLEYAISDIELRDTKEKLKAVDDQLERETGARHGVTERQNEMEDEIEYLEGQVREVKDRIDQAGVETKQLRRQIESKVKERAKLQLQIADIEAAQEEDEKKKESAGKELEELADQIMEAKSGLEELLPDFNSVMDQEARLSER
jgi:structural maintenance of chromosome 3 (chondroitin sulfate proteoglycan 6)